MERLALINPDEIIHKIIDMQVLLLLEDILVSSLTVLEHFTGELKQHRQMRPPEARIISLQTDHNDTDIYKMDSPQVKVRIDSGGKILALIDTRAEINIIDEK